MHKCLTLLVFLVFIFHVSTSYCNEKISYLAPPSHLQDAETINHFFIIFTVISLSHGKTIDINLINKNLAKGAKARVIEKDILEVQFPTGVRILSTTGEHALKKIYRHSRPKRIFKEIVGEHEILYAGINPTSALYDLSTPIVLFAFGLDSILDFVFAHPVLRWSIIVVSCLLVFTAIWGLFLSIRYIGMTKEGAKAEAARQQYEDVEQQLAIIEWQINQEKHQLEKLKKQLPHSNVTILAPGQSSFFIYVTPITIKMNDTEYLLALKNRYDITIKDTGETPPDMTVDQKDPKHKDAWLTFRVRDNTAAFYVNTLVNSSVLIKNEGMKPIQIDPLLMHALNSLEDVEFVPFTQPNNISVTSDANADIHIKTVKANMKTLVKAFKTKDEIKISIDNIKGVFGAKRIKIPQAISLIKTNKKLIKFNLPVGNLHINAELAIWCNNIRLFTIEKGYAECLQALCSDIETNKRVLNDRKLFYEFQSEMKLPVRLAMLLRMPRELIAQKYDGLVEQTENAMQYDKTQGPSIYARQKEQLLNYIEQLQNFTRP